MLRWRTLRVIVLVVLVAVLAVIASKRGLGLRLGAAPAALQGPYTTEEAWIVDGIVRDITEMSAYPAQAPTMTLNAVESRYRVSPSGESQIVSIDLREQLWAPAEFAEIAHAIMGSKTPPVAGAVTAPPMHGALLDFTPASLVAANASISSRLTGDMRSWRDHEAAALTLATFALRESASRSSDTRWAMNRLTAHLAMATGLSRRQARRN